ncbi:MAG: SpoIIE family protein phosphatase [Anaerolineae bacterium]|nr:SpoIIE family protein phosphatase [Anaerolineae bacterium]
MEYGLVNHGKSGRRVSGDAYAIVDWDENTLIALIDGLGSGEAAHEAATLARECVETHARVRLEDLLRLCHEALRGTRGAVMMLMRIDRASKRVSFAGVGNIGVRVLSDAPIKPISRNGIVGFRMSNVREFSYPYTKGDVFILHTDGVSTRFVVDERWARHPDTNLQQVAEEIVEDFGKQDDDVTILVAR